MLVATLITSTFVYFMQLLAGLSFSFTQVTATIASINICAKCIFTLISLDDD